LIAFGAASRVNTKREEHREIANNAVSINANTSTPPRVVRAANPSRITYQSERYNQVKILNKRD